MDLGVEIKMITQGNSSYFRFFANTPFNLNSSRKWPVEEACNFLWENFFVDEPANLWTWGKQIYCINNPFKGTVDVILQ